ALLCDLGIPVVDGGQVRIECAQIVPEFHERGTSVLQPCVAIQVLRRTLVDCNEGPQHSNDLQIDNPMVHAQIANSLPSGPLSFLPNRRPCRAVKRVGSPTRTPPERVM